MLNRLVMLTRIGVVLFWFVMILSLASVIPAPFRAPIIWVGLFVLLVHLAEYFFVRKRFDGQVGAEISFIKTVVFGLAHWLPLVTENGTRRSED